MSIGAAVAPPASLATTTSSPTLSTTTLSATTLATPLRSLSTRSSDPPRHHHRTSPLPSSLSLRLLLPLQWLPQWRSPCGAHPSHCLHRHHLRLHRHSHHHRPRHRCCRRRHILCSCSRMGYCCASCYRPAQRLLCQAQVAVAVSSRTAHCRCGAAHPCRDRCLTRRLCRGSTVRGTSLPSIPSGHLPPALTSSTPPGTTRCSQPPCHSYPLAARRPPVRC